MIIRVRLPADPPDLVVYGTYLDAMSGADTGARTADITALVLVAECGVVWLSARTPP